MRLFIAIAATWLFISGLVWSGVRDEPEGIYIAIFAPLALVTPVAVLWGLIVLWAWALN